MFDRSTNLILALALLAAIIGGFAQHQRRSPATPQVDSAVIGESVPALSLPDLQGRPHTLTDYRGHRVLLNFWATWCGPCLKEMPALDQAQRKFVDHGAIVLGIAMDDSERVRSFLAKNPVSYPILLGNLDDPSTSSQLGDTRGILPYSVLVGEDGRIIATHAGELSAARLEDWLSPARTLPANSD